MLYPIAWGVCEGGNVISPDSEAVFYGILDLIAKPVFGAALIWGHRSIEPARLGIRVFEYDEDPIVTGGPLGTHHEKHTNGATNGANTTGTTDATTTV